MMKDQGIDMKLKVLGSSSHGNCYILEVENTSLLLDCGVSIKDIQKALNFDFRSLEGCLLTHEHTDHSKCAGNLIEAGVNIYSSGGTFDVLKIDGHRRHPAKTACSFQAGAWTILPFDTQHDAAEPVGFLIQYTPTGEKLIYLTDSYYSRYCFSGLNYILVECNYCLDILKTNVEAGKVNEVLKNRLLKSHFSLAHCKDFLRANVTTDTRKIVLLHLSDDNSDAARMQREVQEFTGVETVVADAGMEIDLELYPF